MIKSGHLGFPRLLRGLFHFLLGGLLLLSVLLVLGILLKEREKKGASG